MLVSKRRRDKALKDAFLKFFPSSPLSENELHDSFTRLRNFPLLIQECICYKLDWDESTFAQRWLRPHERGPLGPTERETLIIREVMKLHLNMFLEYLETFASQAPKAK
jgi:hypothetical protein